MTKIGTTLPPTPSLSTARLVLCPLALTDSDAVQDLFPQWEVVKFLAAAIPWPYPPGGALTYIRDRALPAVAAGREWHWSIRQRSDPERLIGMIGLMDQDDDNRGFWLDPARQGQGLMTEACEEVTRFWFEVLRRPVLRVPKAVANAPSRRMSERSGMRVIRLEERSYVCGRLPAEVWEITADEWRSRRTDRRV